MHEVVAKLGKPQALPCIESKRAEVLLHERFHWSHGVCKQEQSTKSFIHVPNELSEHQESNFYLQK